MKQLLAVSKVESAIKGRFQDKASKKCDDDTEIYSTAGVPKAFLIVAASFG
jgi:hypothetical protein